MVSTKEYARITARDARVRNRLSEEHTRRNSRFDRVADRLVTITGYGGFYA